MKNYPINSLIFGEGESCVLFLHGWGGSINSFFNFAEKNSKTHKVCLVDFYGFGKSKYPDKVLDTYEYAVELYLFLKKKGISKLSIVAHSFGGRVAILLASMFDLEVEKLILVGSAGLKPKRGLKYKYNVLRYKIQKFLVKKNIKRKESLSKYGSDEYKKLDDLQKSGYVKIVNQDLKYLLKYIRSKVLLVWGEKDKTTPLYLAKRMNKQISSSKIYLYKNSGHFCYLENYLNFASLLQTYL